MDNNNEKTKKVQVGYWVSSEAKELIDRKANRDGVHKSAALDAIIREWSENCGNGSGGLLNEANRLERLTLARLTLSSA